MKLVSLIKNNKTSIVIFFVVLVGFLISTPKDVILDLQQGTYRRLLPTDDVTATTILPYLIIRHKTIEFSEVINSGLITKDSSGIIPYFLGEINGKYFSVYPLINSILVIPFYYLPLVLNKIPELTYHENIIKLLFMGRLSASILTTISVVLFYKMLTIVSDKKYQKLIIIFTLFYAFGTASFSVSSRGLWQHTFSQLINSILILTLLHSRKNEKLVPWLGFILGLLVASRVTNILIALTFTFYVFFVHRKYFVKFILAAIPWVLFLLTYNYFVYGSPFIEGYGSRGEGITDFSNWSTPLTESLPGYFISPARGFIFISPPMVFAFITIYLVFKNRKNIKEFNLLYRYLSVGLILSMIMMGKWFTWHGANAFGHRMLVDYLPILGLLSFEFTKNLKGKKIYLIYILILYSFYVHFNATYFRKSKCGLEHNWSFYRLKLKVGDNDIIKK